MNVKYCLTFAHMKQEQKDTSITFRTSAGVKEKLERMAAKDNRSLSDFIHLALSKLKA